MNILRTCTITVTCLRGISKGRQGFWMQGFWMLDHCFAEKLYSVSFLHRQEVPSAGGIPLHIATFTNDATGEGITSLGATVKELHRDDDSALFEVVANVVKP